MAFEFKFIRRNFGVNAEKQTNLQDSKHRLLEL